MFARTGNGSATAPAAIAGIGARVALVTLLVGLGAAAPAAADMHVTVYNNDLALVKEGRMIEVGSGVSEFSFVGVPARIDPTSVRLDPGKGGDLTVLEQNYRYDLVSRDKLLERYLDRTVRVVTKHDKFHEGVLKSTAGALVLETEDGVVLVGNDEIADLSLPEMPEGLTTRPSRVWTVDNEGKKKRNVEIAYLTGGISWHAEYVAAVDAKDRKMTLGGWVSIENRSGGSYENAHLKVVAGDVHRAVPPTPVRMYEKGRAMAMDASAGFTERSFFEYHIYDLGRATTIADREVKQIQLIEDRTVPLEKVYVFEPGRGSDQIRVKLEFENDKKSGLGIPLPGGKFRVYREDADGALEFAGEDFIDHTPRDEKVSVLLGSAFDLVAEYEVLESKRLADRVQQQRTRIKLRNRKEKEAVTIIVRAHPGGDWRVIEASDKWKKPNAHDLEFEIDVKAGEESVLEYTVRSEY